MVRIGSKMSFVTLEELMKLIQMTRVFLAFVKRCRIQGYLDVFVSLYNLQGVRNVHRFSLLINSTLHFSF